MRLYEFKDACICAAWSFCICFGMLCLFLYACIWFEGWNNIDSKLESLRQQINIETNKTIRLQIMPSAFKGQLNDENHQLKRH